MAGDVEIVVGEAAMAGVGEEGLVGKMAARQASCLMHVMRHVESHAKDLRQEQRRHKQVQMVGRALITEACDGYVAIEGVLHWRNNMLESTLGNTKLAAEESAVRKAQIEGALRVELEQVKEKATGLEAELQAKGQAWELERERMLEASEERVGALREEKESAVLGLREDTEAAISELKACPNSEP